MKYSMESIVFEAKQKKQLRDLIVALKKTGFDRLRYRKGKLVLEKLSELETGNVLLYQIVLSKKTIELRFPARNEKQRRKRLFTVLPVFLHVLTIADPWYQIKPSPFFKLFLGFINDVSGHLGKDALDLSSEVDEVKTKYDDLLQKYEDLVRSSEENARILLECERRRDELHKRVDQLEGLPDEALKQTLFDWIKVHGGSLAVSEFSKQHNLPFTRVEEGIQMLVEEGYIKRRAE